MNLYERLRILWAGVRYDFWLDVHFVPAKTRRVLRRDLKANLAEAATNVGTSKALANVGAMRRLAAETTRGTQIQSRWLAGVVVGFSTLAALLVLLLLASLYYADGVLDSGATEPVGGTLFPFLGSTIEVNNQGAGQGFIVGVSPGPLPFLVAGAALVFVAKPWRSIKRAAADSEAAAD